MLKATIAFLAIGITLINAKSPSFVVNELTSIGRAAHDSGKYIYYFQTI
jgi:hypothetical protein